MPPTPITANVYFISIKINDDNHVSETIVTIGFGGEKIAILIL